MGLYTIMALAFALSADAFSFSLGLGMAGVNFRQIIKISLTVLAFHIIMPLIGYYVGGFFGSHFGRTASILGAVILVLLGLRMMWEGLQSREDNFSRYLLASGYGIIILGATVSLDALSVGFTLGTQRVALGLTAVIIGTVAGIMTFSGLGLGRKVGEWMGHRAVIIGGLVLIYIGIRLVL